jgi:hypothetical protein
MAPGDAVDVPALYGDVTIQVNQLQMWQSGTFTIPAYMLSISNSINKIVDTWNGLKDNWLGATADEAQAFDESWSSSIKALFGSEEQPDSGILTRIAAAVQIAASNYDSTEVAVQHMFSEFLGNILAHPDGNAPPDFSRNHTEGPIWETSG